MSDWKTIDYFTDESLVDDPYPYFDELRVECPVLPLPHLGVVAVTGYDEIGEVYRDTDTFSSCNSVIGPFAAFPVPLEGDDVSDIVAAVPRPAPDARAHGHDGSAGPHPGAGAAHAAHHAEAPQDNEAFMWRLADQQLDEFIDDGHCEFISAYAQPFAMLVVADLLGVPEADHQQFREGFGLCRSPRRGRRRRRSGSAGENPLAWLDELLRRLHRGPTPRAPQRRAHRSRAGDVPRRHARRR